MLFFLLINIKMRIVVGILMFMSRNNFIHIVYITTGPVQFVGQLQSTLVISKSKVPLKHFEISVLRYIRFVVLRKNNSNNQMSQMTM